MQAHQKFLCAVCWSGERERESCLEGERMGAGEGGGGPFSAGGGEEEEIGGVVGPAWKISWCQGKEMEGREEEERCGEAISLVGSLI